MGHNKKAASRRDFFSLLTNKKQASAGTVKMLTADGKLVEIDRAVFEAAAKNKKASNKDIYDWMKNPSKES
ncbi:MAG: hypothetical protein NTW29_09695 [Bacteroidetes bacterium]|nr:hypothetical protein [Bacteroidota bacterium]